MVADAQRRWNGTKESPRRPGAHMAMTVRVWTFSLRLSDTEVGRALICPRVRYASILWHRTKRLERRVAAGATVWPSTERELESCAQDRIAGLSAISTLLLASRTIVAIHPASVWNMKLKSPIEAAPGELDSILSRDGRR
jgi:hypothetical protein